MNLYERLTEVTKSVPPYRGSHNRFPISNRNHNHKNFFVEQLDGETVYRITFYYHHSWIPADKMAFELHPNVFQERPKFIKNDAGYWDKVEGEFEYGRYEKVPRTIGIVRPDNTFEFVCDAISQSENIFFNNHVPTFSGVIQTNCRMGGATVRDSWSNPNVVVPLFKGLRVDLNTLKVHESQNVVIHKYNIDRKKAKPLMQKYGDMIKVSRPMLMAMDTETLLNEIAELVEHLENNKAEDIEQIASEANENKNYFESAVLFAWLMNASNIRSIVRYRQSSYYARNFTPEKFHMDMMRGLSKQVYKAESPFTVTEIQAGVPYTSSEWGIDVFCNGEKVNQY